MPQLFQSDRNQRRPQDARRRSVESAPDLDWWAAYFEKIEASDFLKGKNDRKWKAKFDWLINEANMNKVLEGNYDREEGESNGRTETAQRNPQQYTRGFKE